MRQCIIVCLLILAHAIFAFNGGAQAKVTSELKERPYKVWGSSPRALVSYMYRRPFRGDYGPALANIRPKYQLKLSTTKGRDGQCRVARSHLHIRFVMTLPAAQQSQNFSHRTRSYWNAFRRFTRRHELTHRRIYLGCARSVDREFMRLRARSCRQLIHQARRKLAQSRRLCEVKHRAFDRREFPRVPQLSLFRASRGRAVWR